MAKDLCKELCADCGKVFDAGPNSFLCPSCRKKHTQNRKPRLQGRAVLIGKPLDPECKRARTTSGEYGPQDKRTFCYGLYDDWGEDIRDKCIKCPAYAMNAEPPKTTGGKHMTKHRIVRYYNGTKGYGRTFDTEDEARAFIATDPKIKQDREDGFTFDVEECGEPEPTPSEPDKPTPPQEQPKQEDKR